MKQRNYVHKHGMKYNRAQTHRDRKNDYKRQPKHKGKAFDNVLTV